MIIKIIAKIMMIMMILTVAAKVGRSVVRYIDYSETLLWIIPTLLMMMIVAMSIFIVILSHDEQDGCKESVVSFLFDNVPTSLTPQSARGREGAVELAIFKSCG